MGANVRMGRLEGRQETIFAERDRKLETAREERRMRRQAARKEARQQATDAMEIP